MSAMNRALQTIHDVPAVVGVFVAHESGTLLARSPALWIPDDLLAAVCARIETMFEAVVETIEDSREIALTFDSHRLIMRRTAPYTLAVLAQPQVNAEALRMASNIALRQILQALGTSAGEVPGRGRPAPVAPAEASAPARPAKPLPAPDTAPKNVVPNEKKKSDIWG
jgi:predicted regulator of Ras-like GTPase activity (Roadblock/LC7/MglB family)